MPTVYERINQQAELNKAAHYEITALQTAIHAIYHPPHRRSPATGALYVNWATATFRLNVHLLARRAGALWWENPALWLGFGQFKRPTEKLAIFNVTAHAMGMPHIRTYEADVGETLPNVVDRVVAVGMLRRELKAGYF